MEPNEIIYVTGKTIQETSERFIKNFNEIVACEQMDEYRTKQHLIDRWDSYCEAWIDEYTLNIEG